MSKGFSMSDKGQNRIRPALIVFDFDGVLTDNRVLVLEDGREAVFCNRADGLAFDMLRRAAIPTLILSTETNPVVSVRARKLQVPVLQSVSSKVQTLQSYCENHKIPMLSVMFIGNDINDLEVMKAVGYPVAAADAHPHVKAVARFISRCAGGEGVARDIVENLVRFNEDDD